MDEVLKMYIHSYQAATEQYFPAVLCIPFSLWTDLLRCDWALNKNHWRYFPVLTNSKS